MKTLFLLCLVYSSYSYSTCMGVTGKITNCDDHTVITAPTSRSLNTEAMLQRMRDDFKRKLEGSILPNLGDSMSWGNGTITRTKKGEFRFVTTVPTYYETTITLATNLNQLANECSSANDQFMSDYGVDLLNSNIVGGIVIDKTVKTDNQEDYVCKAKDSSMMLLITAAEQYKNKTLTKEQFIEVALSVSKMGSYYNKVSEVNNREAQFTLASKP